MSLLRARVLWSLAGLCGGLLCAGCPPARTLPEAQEARQEDAAWIELLPPGRGLEGWHVLQGSARYENGAMVLDGRKADATVMAKGLALRNGIVEFEVFRREPLTNAGPCTLALRLPMRIAWASIYFVCRPASVEACRATWRDKWPAAQQRASFEAASGPETWRFVLEEGYIHCYRLGRKTLSFPDPQPSEGSIGITAAQCLVEIRSVRYRLPASPDPPNGGE